MIKIFKNDKILSESLALEIILELKKKKKLVLGCPSGRSLKKTYYYLGRISYNLNISLDKLKIVMMDEFVKKNKGKYELVDPKSHFSCVRFSKIVLKKLLNYKKNKKNSLKEKNILFPTLKDPKNYNKLIKKLGGIDIFLLASGATDGHVAFNNVKSKTQQKTHIILLSKQTRKDNMKSFTNFNYLSEVPTYGLTVGLNTITSLSKKAILVLTGKDKKYSWEKLKKLKKFNKNWPSSIVYKCKNYKIYLDSKVNS